MHIPQHIRDLDDYRRCIEFHGHTCMGVTIGYMAAKLGLKLLEQERAEDEEIIAIVENDACCCDAIQVLTGCTFGKGNFFFLDYGKMAFTFASRTSGRGYRLLLRSDIFEVPKEERELAEIIGAGGADLQTIKKYETMFEERSELLFQKGPEGFFEIEELHDFDLPTHAVKAPSVACDLCGEMVMETKLELIEDKKVCAACS